MTFNVRDLETGSLYEWDGPLGGLEWLFDELEIPQGKKVSSFALTMDGDLILIDVYGRFYNVPSGRFKVEVVP